MELIAHEADIVRHVGGGKTSAYVSRKRKIELKREGVAPQEIERMDGIVLIISEANPSTVTCMHDLGKAARRYRRQMRNGWRRRSRHRRMQSVKLEN
jgi:hypothetical protein